VCCVAPFPAQLATMPRRWLGSEHMSASNPDTSGCIHCSCCWWWVCVDGGVAAEIGDYADLVELESRSGIDYGKKVFVKEGTSDKDSSPFRILVTYTRELSPPYYTFSTTRSHNC
jgi:hypothetical protein